MIDDDALQQMKLTAFEAASDASRWNTLVKDIRHHFGASSVYFRSPASPGMPARVWWVDSGTDADTKARYVQQWGRQDPWAIHPLGHDRSLAGRCFIGSQILPWKELVRTEFYNDFGRTVGLKGVMSALVEDGRNGSIAPPTRLALFREHGLPEFDVSQLRAFQSLQPAFRRALHSYWAFEKLRADASVVSQTLDAMPSPLWVLRRDRSVDFANHAARALDGKGLIRCVAGKLASAAQLHEARLSELLELASAGMAQEIGLWAPDAGGFSTAAMHLTRVLPDSAIARHWPHSEVLMVLQHDNAARTKEARIQAIAARCRLTAAELRVLRRLSGGDATQAIAQDLGVGLPTIRTHIRRLLEKTYSRRLIDLLRLVGD